MTTAATSRDGCGARTRRTGRRRRRWSRSASSRPPLSCDRATRCWRSAAAPACSCAWRRSAARGVHGIDAAQALVELARLRAPSADVRVGDAEALPYADASFDLVAGFNVFFFASDLVAALREAGRVARAGAPVVAGVWGRPEACDMLRVIGAVRALGGAAGRRRAVAGRAGRARGARRAGRSRARRWRSTARSRCTTRTWTRSSGRVRVGRADGRRGRGARRRRGRGRGARRGGAVPARGRQRPARERVALPRLPRLEPQRVHDRARRAR